ncbi:hypothetical protein MHM95_00570 [Pseudoalteromonas sp. CnMc7-15]|uniref:hypothetical protein n=1 Tax=unclassified Pseudoalteromonas TaxID=194690 RepID=UPI001EF53241|nr:hypothetical protein [Pseudoalteromonas sp. CnMc7-15]MCG7564789.1 hypothetical protein [Pseudoalteromonas sp. CnMc7-15]
MWQQILDLPVIVQGALGSGLFWLAFEIGRRVINITVDLIGKINKNTHRELLTYEALYHSRCMHERGTSEDIAEHVMSIFAALRRFLVAMIYVCLGLASAAWIGELAIIAYLISVFNLFLALRALKIVWGSGMTREEHMKNYVALMESVRQNA